MKHKLTDIERIKGILAHIVYEMFDYGRFMSKERAEILLKEINKIKSNISK